MSFVPRKWQEECHARFLEKIGEGEKEFVIEACMGAGKSALAAWLAKTMLDDYGIDHVIALVPWRSIQDGMLRAFGHSMRLETRDRFFVAQRRQARQPMPEIDATVTLYQEISNEAAIDTLRMWQAEKGFRFALICDEIHHTNETSSTWGTYVEQISKLADYSVFMSGTYFRSDRQPIGCIRVDDDGLPIKHYRYTYSNGVKDNVVRAVTTRNFDPAIRFIDNENGGKEYFRELSQITGKELSEARRVVLEPSGEHIRDMIRTVHDSLTLTRTKFRDAACLFVCRPGKTEDDSSTEDRHVHQIAEQIREITSVEPTVVTHRDTDAVGKIAAFRRGVDPYLVAVNMVSEGCDIPRLRAVAFCRYVTSEMLFRQIVGRALRIHEHEDGTAAQVYLPAFPVMLEFAERLYAEAQEGIQNRRCKVCGNYPCSCPCPCCGKRPCECPCPHCWQRPCVCDPEPQALTALDVIPALAGGNIGADYVQERYVALAGRICRENTAHTHANHTQLGHAFQKFEELCRVDGHDVKVVAMERPDSTPDEERERLRRTINRQVNYITKRRYGGDHKAAWTQEIISQYGMKFSEIMKTWPIYRIREVAERIEIRYKEALRNG